MMPFLLGKKRERVLTVNKYREQLLAEFYLDSDDRTVRRNQDGWRGKYMKHDAVKPFRMVNRIDAVYGGIHIPRTRATVQHSHLILLLRGIEIPEGCVVDHLDGDPTNNSPANLRVTTQNVNAKNQRMRKNNTSGYTGINFNPKVGLYMIRRTIQGKRLYQSAKTLKSAIAKLKEFEAMARNDGYTDRHGK